MVCSSSTCLKTSGSSRSTKPNGTICRGCSFARSATTLRLAKGVSKQAVKFRRSESLRRSGMKFAFLSSKCTCTSTMRVLEEARRWSSAAALGERVSGEVQSLDTSAEALAPPRNCRRDTCWVILTSPCLRAAGCAISRNPEKLTQGSPDQLECELQLPVARCRAVDRVERSEG